MHRGVQEDVGGAQGQVLPRVQHGDLGVRGGGGGGGAQALGQLHTQERFLLPVQVTHHKLTREHPFFAVFPMNLKPGARMVLKR